MARPRKIGLPYFPLDSDLFEDKKIKRLLRKYGSDGYLTYAYIRNQCYKDKGYYVELDDDFLFDIHDAIKIKENKVKKIISYSLEINLFDIDQHKYNNILTSNGIQERYVSACKAMGRKNYDLIPDFVVGNPQETIVSSRETPVYQEETGIIQEESTQSKVKESKVKESKVKESKGFYEIPENANFESMGYRGQVIHVLKKEFDYPYDEENEGYHLDRFLSQLKGKCKTKDKGIILNAFRGLVENLDDWSRKKLFSLKYFNENFGRVYTIAKTENQSRSPTINLEKLEQSLT